LSKEILLLALGEGEYNITNVISLPLKSILLFIGFAPFGNL
jgi:hypothetical protein